MKKYFLSILIFASLIMNYSLNAQKTKSTAKTYDFVLESKIGDAGNNFLSFPSGIFIDSKNNICVTDTKDICVKVFDKKGKLIKKLGQKGSGPGDFGWMQFTQNDSKGNLIIYDFLKKRLSVYDRNYKFLKTININDGIDDFISLPNNQYMAVVRGIHSKTNQLTKYYLQRFDQNLKKIKTIDSLDIYSMYEDKDGGFTYEYFDSYYFRIANGNIMLATGADYKIRIYSQEGKKLTERKIDYRPVRLEEKEKELFFEARPYMGKKEKKIVAEIRNKPGIATVIVDNSGKIFVETFEVINNKALFDVFSFKGDFLYKAEFPNNFPYQKCTISDGYIYFIMLGDKTTPPYIGKYKIVEK